MKGSTNPTVNPREASWQAGMSMAMEVDAALSIVNGYFQSTGLPPALFDLVQGMPEDWLADSESYLGAYGQQVDLLEFAAGLAGVLLQEDYGSLTLAIRQTTLDEVVARLAAEFEPAGAETSNAVPPAERLARLVGRRTAATYLELGLDRQAVAVLGQRAEHDATRVARLLRGGELHAASGTGWTASTMGRTGHGAADAPPSWSRPNRRSPSPWAMRQNPSRPHSIGSRRRARCCASQNCGLPSRQAKCKCSSGSNPSVCPIPGPYTARSRVVDARCLSYRLRNRVNSTSTSGLSPPIWPAARRHWAIRHV